MDLKKYSKVQIEAIKSRGNVCVLASAGSGKTTLLIGRTEDLTDSGVNQDNILLITFSRKATDNMTKKLFEAIGENDVNIGTFHSVCYNILKNEDAFFSKAKIMKDYVKKKFICDIVVRSLRILTKDSDVDVPNILNFISIQKANMKYYTDKDLLFVEEQPFTMEVMREIYREYELDKIRQGYLDFDDMQYYCVRMLKAKPRVLEKYRNQYKYILVDEGQDTNENQIDFLKMLNSHEQMFWVGDFRQSIYAFRGSSPKFIMNFEKIFKDAKIIHMKTNYRCSKSIVDISNKLLEKSEEKSHKYYTDAEAHSTYEHEPEFKIYLDGMEEAEQIGTRIQELMAGDKKLQWKDIAIIYRVNAQTCSLERVFSEMGIPYVIYGGARSFFEAKEIQDILAFLKLGMKKDDSAFERIYCVPPRWLGKAFLEEVAQIANTNNTNCFDSIKNLDTKIAYKYRSGIADLENIHRKISQMLGKCNIGDILRTIREMTGYDSYISKEVAGEEGSCEKVENLEMLCEQASHYVDAEKFLEDIEKIIMAKEEKQQDRKNYDKINSVQLMTGHKSKGLEFKYVFGISINGGLFPHYRARETGEERRLLYVLCTRAEKILHLSSTLLYNRRDTIPSEFLYDIFDKNMIDEKIKKKRDSLKIKDENKVVAEKKK